jgi:Putative stress-induced transcription regulator/CGNR zinc finger
VNLASFAELAVRLVNSGTCSAESDPLRSHEAFREFIAERPFLAAPITRQDLDRLKLVRAELAVVFSLTVHGNGLAAADRLNALLMIHPVQPVLVAHDDEPLHVHLSESGSVADRYAAASVVSLAMLLSQLGAERFGICAIASCDQVFIDGSRNKSRRYCEDHSAARTNVTSLRQRHEDAIPDQAGTVATAVS